MVILLVITALCVSFFVCIFGGGPFVPTKMEAVHEVLKAAKIKKGDRLYDIGAGDGRFVHFAVKDYKAVATGFEIDPFVFLLAQIRKYFFGWKGEILRANFTKQNISDADIIICYMLPRSLKKFQKKFERELKKGAKIISYAFSVGNLKPQKIIPRKGKISQIFVYKITKKKSGQKKSD